MYVQQFFKVIMNDYFLKKYSAFQNPHFKCLHIWFADQIQNAQHITVIQLLVQLFLFCALNDDV